MTIAATFLPRHEPLSLPPIAFIGGGNMAGAILGGLLQRGAPLAGFEVVEPMEEARTRLRDRTGLEARPAADEALGRCSVVVWAVKPQVFAEAAAQAAPWLAAGALHLSIAAGIPSASIARWLGSERIVRAMPNTPALVGQGMTGLFARAGVDATAREAIAQVLAATGELLWVDDEAALDAVTALSGSGPAYVFYFLEAMIEAGQALGLPAADARRLALATFRGATALAGDSNESPQVLRAQVTSKGGTTFAALSVLEQADVKARFVEAMAAAHRRAGELASEFGRG